MQPAAAEELRSHGEQDERQKRESAQLDEAGRTARRCAAFGG